MEPSESGLLSEMKEAFMSMVIVIIFVPHERVRSQVLYFS